MFDWFWFGLMFMLGIMCAPFVFALLMMVLTFVLAFIFALISTACESIDKFLKKVK